MNDLNVIFDKCPIYICTGIIIYILSIFMALKQEYVPESILKVGGTSVAKEWMVR